MKLKDLLMVTLLLTIASWIGFVVIKDQPTEIIQVDCFDELYNKINDLTCEDEVYTSKGLGTLKDVSLGVGMGGIISSLLLLGVYTSEIIKK